MFVCFAWGVHQVKSKSQSGQGGHVRLGPLTEPQQCTVLPDLRQSVSTDNAPMYSSGCRMTVCKCSLPYRTVVCLSLLLIVLYVCACK